MESLLERGEKLDDLVAKSEHLGNQSKAFYKTVSRQQNCQHWAERAEPSGWMPVCKPAGTETELLLRNHVMPLPGPRGHASLCLSALPTTPIMPPVVEPVDRRCSPEEAGIHCKKGLRVASAEWGWLGGAKTMMGLFRGRSDICIIFKLYKCKHLCGVWIPAEDIFDIVYWWRPVEATILFNVFSD